MRLGDLLVRDLSSPLETVVKITDHDARRVWSEMSEYVVTDTLKNHFREVLDALAETRQGATERACVWVSGFFGSGKSHFLKVLGYLLEDRDLIDRDGHSHRSGEFLCRRLGLDSFLPLLQRELRPKVLYINLLDHDPQNPQRPTFSRLITRNLLEQANLSTEFWVASWERDLRQLGKWEDFLALVLQTYGRAWEEERRLHAEAVLKRALPVLLPDRYRTEDEAAQALRESKRTANEILPSETVAKLREDAERLDPQKGRVILLLDELGLYVGDSVERLNELTALTEQVAQRGAGKVLLIATAQEALTDLVPRLTADRQVLEWLRDRFRLRIGLEPTEVTAVVAGRLLRKNRDGDMRLRELFRTNQGALLSALNVDHSLTEGSFVGQYPCPPYMVGLMQDIMGAMRGSVEEARRLSGSERSMLKLVHAILVGEGGLVRGRDQPVGWLTSLDLFYDALAPDLTAVQSEQVRVIREMDRLGEMAGLPVARVAKALFLLQHVRERIPCTPDHVAAVLIDRVDADLNQLKEAVRRGLERLREDGWAAEEEGQFRLLTPAEHDLERDVRANYPSVSEVKQRIAKLVKENLRDFRYLHGQIRRELSVAISVDGESPATSGDLLVELLTSYAEHTRDTVLARSISEQHKLFWKAAEDADGELATVLNRTIAVEKALEQWQSRTLPRTQDEHRQQLEREARTARDTRLPDLLRRAFLNGSLFKGGRELPPQGEDIASALQAALRPLAEQLFTQFIDHRPDRDEDCVSVLTWQMGGALPAVYGRLGLVGAGNQLNQDAGCLSTLKGELARRRQRGLPTSGGDLVDHFAARPYGWDQRVVRLLVATLFKVGLLSVRYQNRELHGPGDPQVGQVFGNAREFRKAVFVLLSPVDWRKASELCSSLFGVPGGDTFERTASLVHEQAQAWSREAGQLAARCQDNGLPPSLVGACGEATECLVELARIAEPNARLRRFLELADTLGELMPVVQRLKRFAFDQYRNVRDFVRAAGEWAGTSAGEARQCWRRLVDGLQANDLPERWNQVRQDHAFLLGRYQEDYAGAHQAFVADVREAIVRAREHEAFRHDPEAAERALAPLAALECHVDPSFRDGTFHCPGCGRSFAGLARVNVREAFSRVEAELYALIPRPPAGTLEPFSSRGTVTNEGDLDALTSKLRSYWHRAGRPIEVEITARARGDEGC